ncbi:hypothetical protein ASE86_11400 [Sphingomonas sp. Leaf33]|uniref:YoaK family protein n=1 Tax=Sphingomonas sp. Leaf33 TaxID=1736215 RepID=UPI0007010156|nr:YoaK family protein [Sphingomonas sp. Leaf33]KQN26667.1 hypothetical protein ASE86_11400 [Sphingomonas sp. Leaf33]
MTRYPAPLAAAAVALAALAGFVDAVAWIELAGFFALFMSGNSTRVAIGVATGDWGAVRIGGGLLLMFLSGVMAASVVGHRFAGRHKAPVMLVVTVALTAAACAAWWGHVVAPLLLLAFAMGAENGVFNRDREVTIGLTYMTGTLVRLGQQFAASLMRVPGEHAWMPYLTLWLGFVCGGVLGALASRASLASAVTVAAVVAGILTVVLAVVTERVGRVRRV